MNMNDYFDPVSLDKPDLHLLPENLLFCRYVDIHTPNIPIKNIENYDIAIIGVPEEKNAFVPGSAKAPDRVRSKLYQLSSVNRKIRIIDLGNLKITDNINDTYYALRDITIELRSKNVLVIFIGGSQDLTYGINMAFDKIRKRFTLCAIDARLDFGTGGKKISSITYLDHILKSKKGSDYNFFNIGNQAYFTHLKIIDRLEKQGHECIRLGEARRDISQIEPYLRDSGFVSIDMSCVRHSDAPGVTIPSPNGFFGHELCQMARYAGVAPGIEGIGIFELFPDIDMNEQTSHLAAQAIWYFIEGFSLKLLEKKDGTLHKKYHIHLQESGHELVFYKSARTERWWMELPVINEETGKNLMISCNYSDYQKACNHEIPDRWLKAYNRYS